uniref:Uncharacterized protein n=1 Tax=Panagrolaimus davidi TaxID=227884 RepID=A0A914QKK3_9BILA
MFDGIQAVAMDADSTTPTLPTDPHQKEFLAGNRLAVVVRKTLKSRKADYGRLVLDFTHTSNLHDAILRKNEMGITAPVIVALGTHPEVTFYICVDDDDILRVRGQFGDALQSFMEIVHLFNLEYDKQTVGITYFLEAVMGMKNQLTSGRQQLLDVLLPRQKTLDSTNSQTSNDATETHMSQSSNAEPSALSEALQSYDDSLLQYLFPSEPTTPISRKRTTQSSDYSGKKSRPAQFNSSVLHTSVQQTYNSASSQLQDREPSPSIFD